MRTLLALILVACGAPAVQAGCPSVVGHESPCCEEEIAEQRCVAGQAWVCEPSSPPCYDFEEVNGGCPPATDGGLLHPELLSRRVWYENGACP